MLPQQNRYYYYPQQPYQQFQQQPYPQFQPPSPQLPPVSTFDKVIRIIKYILPYAVPIIIFVLVAFTGMPLALF